MPNRDPERIPPPESYRRWRRYLGWFALLSAVGLVYASLIPLNFYFQPLETAFSGFTHAPWLNLGIYKRADWVANALVVLPIGFAGTGAICLGRQAKLQHVFAVAFLVAAIMFLIAAIEFVQVWFPPRTVSLNDIAAGWLGSLLGPPLWLLAGGPLVNHLLRAQTTSDPDSRKASFCVWLLAAYLTCLCIWSLLPGDLILSKHELMVKYEAGRIAMVPGSELASATGSRDFLGKVISLFGSVVKLVPLGFLAFISKIEARKKICLLVCVPTALELLQLPVFSRHFSTSDVLLGWLGAWLGWCLAGQTDRLIALNRLLIVRYALLLLNVSVILVAFSFGATRLATAAEIETRWTQFFSWPFVRYYYGTEFSAGFNLLMKAFLFLTLGLALANLISKYAKSPRHCRQIRVCMLILVAAFGFLLELMQIALIPCVPDASDTFVYVSGAIGGFLLWDWFDRESRHEREPTADTPQSYRNTPPKGIAKGRW